MAGASKTSDEEVMQEETAAPPPKKSKKLVFGIIGVLLLAGAAGGGYWFYGKKKAADPEHAAAEGEHGEAAAAGVSNFLPLTPAFVVNLADDDLSRFLQVEMEVSAKDAKALEAAKLYMPRIRNGVLLLLSQQHYHELTTREGKETLQKQSLAQIQKILKEETGSPGIDAVYFTSFVMQ
jgi:flagellar FliL protein